MPQTMYFHYDLPDNVSYRSDTDIPDEHRCHEWPAWNIFSGLTYSYMSRILLKGRRQFQENDHLTFDDLFRVPEDTRADFLVRQFWSNYWTTKSLPKSIWQIVKNTYIPAGIWEFIYSTSRAALPLLLQKLLKTIQNNPDRNIVADALPYAICMTLCFVLGAFSQNRVVFLATKSGIMVRAALTSAIYEHALRLTPKGRRGLSTGEITNLVAVDTQKLFDVMLEGHNVWSCPMLTIVVTVLLGVMIDPILISGVFVLLLFLPIVKFFVKRMLIMRKERSTLTDDRIDIISAMLQGMLVTKLNHYERKIESRINKVRSDEIRVLHGELQMWGWIMTAAVCSPLIATAIAFILYVLVKDGNIITPADAFTTLLLFSILRFPINMTARLIGKMAQALEALRRIDSFLNREIKSNQNKLLRPDSSDMDQILVDIDGATFVIDPEEDLTLNTGHNDDSTTDVKSTAEVNDIIKVEKESVRKPFMLQQIALSLKKSETIAVIGRIGSGKSLLLRAILGEVGVEDDSRNIRVNGSVSYSPQTPFILNTSLRDNILFGSQFIADRYDSVIQDCNLTQDILQLGTSGDLTQIGERGVTLSGGQKQRVALARALYADSDIVLLDDVFSALDASTSSDVFHSLFGNKKGEGSLSQAGTILVTHAMHFLSRVDKVLLMSDGKPSFYGTWEELKTKSETSGMKLDLTLDDHDRVPKAKRDFQHKRELGEGEGFIMTMEEREFGVATARTWLRWFHHAGGLQFVIFQILFVALDRGFYIASDWWLAIWSDAAYEQVTILGFTIQPQSSGRDAQVVYSSVYSVIVFLSIIAAALRSQWAFWGGARCAAFMFSSMLESVLRAPMTYFDTTPLGRVLNRFTYDVEVLDIELSVSMAGTIISSSWLLSSVIVMVAVLPWVLIGLVPILYAYYLIQAHYRMSGPDLQRLDAVSRSPIQAGLAEGLDGATSIRAYRKEGIFARKFRSLMDTNSSAMLNFVTSQRWLSLRIEMLGAAVNTLITFLVVCLHEQLDLDAGKVGLIIMWSVIFSTALNFFFIRLSETEARVTSIERIHKMSKLQSEKPWETTSEEKVPETWPEKGELVFQDVSLRYRPELDLALKEVSFAVKAGTRAGVVGRTGSGKTSLTTALFRLVEIESGQILVDGVNLQKIGLSDVRGRNNCLRMIPQDPVLFAGTLKDCVDPFQSATDEAVFEALKAVQYKGIGKGLDVLKEKVEEGGTNFSVGERQLLCLARAIIEEPRILVLDEATASVDSQTDQFIQHMLRSRFKQTTLLTIAHRLQTIMDYDTLIVMENGHCVEIGSPVELMNSGGVFQGLVEATGAETAQELRNIALGF